MSEYPCNEKNNTFTWLSSLYNPFKLYFLDQKREDKIFNKNSYYKMIIKISTISFHFAFERQRRQKEAM